MRSHCKQHLSTILLSLFLAVPFVVAQSSSPGDPADAEFDKIVEFCSNFQKGKLQVCGLELAGILSIPDPAPRPVSASRIEANLGQSDASYPFLARGQGVYLFLNGLETAIDLRGADGRNLAVVRLQLEGAANAAGDGLEPLPHRLNYFIGNDASRWVSNVPVFSRVRFNGVYPGVDVVHYTNAAREFEHDYVVAPGADPSKIRLRFTGAESVEVQSGGELIVRAAGGALTWKAPRLYQKRGGREHDVSGRYHLLGTNRVAFRVGNYDRALPLIIDPSLSLLTYIGGPEPSVAGRSTIDAAGNIYLTGATGDGNWPSTPGAALTNTKGFTPTNAFLTKMNASGSSLVYSTFFGGVNAEMGTAVALDAQGNAYVTGATDSKDFPTTPNAFRTTVPPAAPTNPDLANCFVTKFNPAGSAVVYSTYLYGRQKDGCTAIAVDAQGAAFVTGGTDSTDFPTTEDAFQQTYRLGSEAQRYDTFVTKLNPAGSGLVYSTFLGGGGNDVATGLAIDAQGNAYVTGTTTSTNFPVTQSAASGTYGGSGGNEDLARFGDGFVYKLNPAGTQLLYSTYIGGNRDDLALAIAIDSQGAAYVTGNTLSTNFFTTPNAVSRTLKGIGGEPAFKTGDAFVVKVNPDGRSFGYATLIGGAQDDRGVHIAVDRTGSAFVGGHTLSPDFPVTGDAAQPRLRTAANTPTRLKLGNAFLLQLDPAGEKIVYSTFLGGTNHEFIGSVSLAADGAITATGTTNSSDLAVSTGAYQRTFFGTIPLFRPLGDVFVARLGNQAQPAIAGLVNAASYASNASPGMIAVIAGSNIGPDVLQTARLDANGNLASTLAETTVTVNNRPAPLVYVSKAQTSFIVPYETPVGPNAQVVVTYGGVRSVAFPVTVVPANPGIFSANSSGTGQGAIVNEDSTFNSAQNPAAKGSIIVFFVTGEGQTDPPGSDGQIANSVFPKPAQPVRVDIGGIQAVIEYVGAVPGQVAGLMQVNARIPANSNSGPVPVQITVGTAQSQRALTVAVR